MSAGPDPLIDEHVLRRALRLDADEVPPRLDATRIAARATASSRGQREIALAVVVAFAGGWVWAEALRAAVAAAVAAGVDPLGGALDLLAAAILWAAPIAAAATQPVVPLAILVAAAAAAFSERTRRSYGPATSRAQRHQ